MLQHEYNIMMKLNHPNIIKPYGFYRDVIYENESGENLHVSALVMEYANNGDLFELVRKVGKTPFVKKK
jgi:serine/threonine protein kinase